MISGTHMDLGVTAAQIAAAIGAGMKPSDDVLARAASLLGHVDRTLPSGLDMAWEAIGRLASPGDKSAVGLAYNQAIRDALRLLEIMGAGDPALLVRPCA